MPTRSNRHPNPAPSAAASPTVLTTPTPQVLAQSDSGSSDRDDSETTTDAQAGRAKLKVPKSTTTLPPAGWSRQTWPDGPYFAVSNGQAYSNDNRVYFAQTYNNLVNPGTDYTMPAPPQAGQQAPNVDSNDDSDADGRPGTKRITWAWTSPDAMQNKTRDQTCLSVILTYKMNGKKDQLHVRVEDPAYPGGRLWQSVSGTGTLPAYTLAYGEGLAPAGDGWTLSETIASQQTPPTVTALQMRSISATITAGSYESPGGNRQRGPAPGLLLRADRCRQRLSPVQSFLRWLTLRMMHRMMHTWIPNEPPLLSIEPWPVD